jgi:hypothetical protein
MGRLVFSNKEWMEYDRPNDAIGSTHDNDVDDCSAWQ